MENSSEITKRERSMCLGKVKHTNMTSAQYAADQMIRLPNSARLQIYPCPFCLGFHIGKTNDKYLKQIRDEQSNKDNGGDHNSFIDRCGTFRLAIEEDVPED